MQTYLKHNPEIRSDVFIFKLSMIIIFFFFGYAKWFPYEAEGISIFIANSPFVSWLHTLFGIRGASFFLGTVELSISVLLLMGLWFPFAGLAGAAGSTLTFIITTTFLFSTPGAVVPAAGGFPALSSIEQFLLKDIVLLCVSLLLLRHEIVRLKKMH